MSMRTGKREQEFCFLQRFQDSPGTLKRNGLSQHNDAGEPKPVSHHVPVIGRIAGKARL